MESTAMDEEELEEFLIPEEAYEKLSDPSVIRRYIEEGKTFQEIIGYSQESMDVFYLQARKLYMKGLYEKANSAFLFLTTLNPFVPGYWVGMGLCEQMREDYHAALAAYGMASLSDDRDPYPHYYSAICYYYLNERDNARHSMELAQEYISDRDDLLDLKQSILSAKERIY
ncbi:MAG: SycD/LcrH family type III secretion system chaperone [Chlamydiia bacterium]|nr:SycD/LcrH family type III secretion system chaperone [Chlamydiia bacterium]